MGSKRRERKGKEEVRESIRSRSDGEVQVLVTGEKRKRVPVRCGLPRPGSLVERKTLVGAEEHQHQQRCVVRRAKRKSFEEGREMKRRGASNYRRREPEKSLLYETVRGDLKTFLAEIEHDGSGSPRFVVAEFERYLRCGILANGFARVRRVDCGDELLQRIALTRTFASTTRHRRTR